MSPSFLPAGRMLHGNETGRLDVGLAQWTKSQAGLEMKQVVANLCLWEGSQQDRKVSSGMN